MALTKAKKGEIVENLNVYLAQSKLTVVATYKGTAVKAMQQLRQQARDTQTTVKVVKNRLVIQALKSQDKLKDIDTTPFNGMLLYAFNAKDEVAPAQALANFAKKQPTIEFVGAITASGQWMQAEDVSALAALPTKDQLRAQLAGTLSAPLSGFINVLAGNVRGLFNTLNARADLIE